MVEQNRGVWYHVTLSKGKRLYQRAMDKEHAESLNAKRIQGLAEAKAQTEYITNLPPEEREAYMLRAVAAFDEYVGHKIEENNTPYKVGEDACHT